MIVYIAGPYRGNIDENIRQARAAAIELWETGMTALCPHMNTEHFEMDCKVDDKVYLDGDLEMLARCDAILILPNWQESVGANLEHEFAQSRDIPVYYYPAMPFKHITEARRPKQVTAFIDVVMKMYRLHLEKNADYSPANILGTGDVGLVNREWDKIARLLNLVGFRIEIESTSFEAPLEPRNESIDENVIDLANYGVIWQIYRKGAWGK